MLNGILKKGINKEAMDKDTDSGHGTGRLIYLIT